MASLKSTVKLASNGLCAKGTSRHSELLKIALQALPSIISMMPSLWSHFWPIFLQYLAFSLIFGLSQTCWVSLKGKKHGQPWGSPWTWWPLWWWSWWLIISDIITVRWSRNWSGLRSYPSTLSRILIQVLKSWSNWTKVSVKGSQVLRMMSDVPQLFSDFLRCF